MVSASILFVISCFLHVGGGAKILGILPLPAVSHYLVGTALFKELAQRGHQVTVMSPYSLQKPLANYTDMPLPLLKLEDLVDISTTDVPNPFEMQGHSYIEGIAMLWAFGNLFCEKLLSKSVVQRLIHSTDQQFDLIIIESFFLDCFLGFSYKFKVPVVQICTFGGLEYMGDLVGNPNPYAYVPDKVQSFSDKMNFKERLINTLGGLFQQVGRRFYLIPTQDKIMRKYFNYTDDIPSIAELEKSTALVLLNHHFSISYPKPLVPSLIQVGGMHVQPPKELSEDLKKYIDEAPDGIIYFSMGSNLNTSLMHEEKLEVLLEAFSKLKQRVLFKWEKDSLPGQPSNVKVGKWMPQSDILAHPNVRLFVTHGGLLSTQETIIRGVPIVGIPIYGDQKLNMARAESAGFGIQLDYSNLTTQTVFSALTEVLENPRYKENARRLSRLFQDQPLPPLQQAVFWTEYVIRHKGAPHMRSAALDLVWYQYFLLDVMALLFLVIGSALLGVFLISKKLCCGKKQIKITATSGKKIN